MSNYQRNTSMVVCIFAVLVIGAISVGLLAYYGTNFSNWNFNPNTTVFSFEDAVGTTNETVTLDIDIAAGGVSVVFVDNESLLYSITLEVQNSTLETQGDPTVTFASNTIGVNYAAAGVNVTLGSGVNYTLNIHAAAGGVDVALSDGAHVGDITIAVTTGGINLEMSDDVVLLGNATFDLSTTTGGISILADLPTGVGGSVECTTTLGSINLTAAGWIQVTSSTSHVYYKTTDYGTASQTLTIFAEATTGGISAVVT
jgi:hypothetical protein